MSVTDDPAGPAMTLEAIKDWAGLLVLIALCVGGFLAFQDVQGTPEPLTDTEKVQCVGEYFRLQDLGVNLSDAPYYADSPEEFCE